LAEVALLEPRKSTSGSVASDLKAERESRKITLAQIAADTRISLHHLQSLEEGRYADLPGGVYNRAFIRAYCESIHVDPKEILERYAAESSPVVEKTSRSRKRIPQQNKLSRHYPIFAWTLMLLISATGLFYSRKWIASVFSPYFPRTPASEVSHKPAAKPAFPPATQPIAETVSTAAVSPSPLRLDIEVTQECWISIDADGKPSVRELLKPGDVQSFDASEKFAIIVGNAGGVSLKINGKPAKPLGKSGEVVRMLIDKTNLQDFFDQTIG
jgi:cytoskeleton protein RodZ